MNFHPGQKPGWFSTENSVCSCWLTGILQFSWFEDGVPYRMRLISSRQNMAHSNNVLIIVRLIYKISDQFRKAITVSMRKVWICRLTCEAF